MKIKIATFNVNSVQKRKNRIINLLDREEIDVLCIQETKSTDENFPKEFFDEHKLYVGFWGEKTFNGVAIISKFPIIKFEQGFDEMPLYNEKKEARFCKGVLQVEDKKISVMSCYVPNGREVGCEHYIYKLNWLKDLKNYLSKIDQGEYVFLAGDFNVIPRDQDVWDTYFISEDTLYVSKKERDAFFDLEKSGFKELTYKFLPDGKNYTFYDYRMLKFQKNEGMRLDFVFCTSALAKCAQSVEIIRDERRSTTNKEEKPSDHVPVACSFEI